MNNSIKYLIKTILLFAVLSSCSDFLDQKPINGLVKEEYWQNKEELHKVMMGAYSALADMDVQLFLNGELRGDMLTKGASIVNCTNSNAYTTGNLRDVMDASILSDNKFAMWDNFYKVINLCNHVIVYAPSIQQKDPTLSDYYMQAYISEATTLRSLMYFYLVRIYHDVPYIDYPTVNDAVDLYPSKTSGEEILKKILQDLVTVGIAEKMSDFYGDDISTIGRMNKFASYALIAEIALWQFNYDLALTYIEKIENSSKYTLKPNSEWFSLFAKGNTFESIFEIQYDAANSQSNGLYNLTVNISSRYFQTSSYVNKLFVEDVYGNRSLESTRKEGTVLWDNGNYKVYKYIGETPNKDAIQGYLRSSNAASANFIVYRYADILLMKAEALTQKDVPDFDGALELINILRVRANVPAISSNVFGISKLAAEEIILEERALELAYEGKRWFDLLRYARRNNYAQKNTFIAKITENASPSQRLIIASKLIDENSWYLPIYQIEIDNNINLKQNPYYVGTGS
ncbi:MAG: RagB/SusD family nutrient uptake outer membrane protein [Prolixibacteraceae bacterium]|nr:RagB/SusD family nutrient uptake outer membrane protein [Prolixibacteraceae bacterium]